MEKKGVLTKILAIVGTVFVWFPILLPLYSSLGLLIQRGVFRFDYLLPAEFFPVVLVGGGLLLWAALRARSQRWLIGGGIGIAAGLLLIGTLLSIVSGLASGETEPAAWQEIVGMVMIGVYLLGVVATAIGGVLLLINLFKPSQLLAKSS